MFVYGTAWEIFAEVELKMSVHFYTLTLVSSKSLVACKILLTSKILVACKIFIAFKILVGCKLLVACKILVVI